MNVLSEKMANGDESEETLRRYGELSAKFEGLGGYDTETPINKVANGGKVVITDTYTMLDAIYEPTHKGDIIITGGSLT